MDTGTVSRRIVERLVQEGAVAVALVGSRAAGEAAEESDLDLAVVGDGPRYRLERHGDLLVSLGWATAEEQRRRLFDPAWLGTHVPGWRAAVLVHDPDGIGAGIQQAARAWTWDDVAGECDAWVAESVTGLAEEAGKLVAALRRGDTTAAAVQRSVIVLGLAAPIAIRRRILYDSENRLWELVADELGRAWRDAQATALGLHGEDAAASARAALRLLRLAVDEVRPLLDDRQNAVLDGLPALS